MDFITKLPNWTRYILSIPFGILISFFISIIIFISNLIYADPNSLWTTLLNFIFTNGISIIAFFYGLNIMLPKHKFAITLFISIILGIGYSILQGISIMNGIMTFEYIIAFIIFIFSSILSCYLSFKYKDNEN